MITVADLADAEACAKGPKQLAFVQEVAEGPAKITYGTVYPWKDSPFYGAARIEGRSFRNLKTRLEAAGFTVKRTGPTDPFRATAVEVWR